MLTEITLQLVTENIIQAYCGEYHSLLLTENDNVYGCRNNKSYDIGLNILDIYTVFIYKNKNIELSKIISKKYYKS